MSTEKEIQDIMMAYYNALPAVLQQAITQSDWRKRVADIGAKYRLHIDQLATFENEVFFTLLGVKSFDSFQERVSENVKVEKEQVANLVNDINTSVFVTIREELKNLTLELKGEEPTLPTTEEKASVSLAPTPSITPSTPVPEKPAASFPDKLMAPVTARATEQKIEDAPLPQTIVTPAAPLKPDPYREPLE